MNASICLRWEKNGRTARKAFGTARPARRELGDLHQMTVFDGPIAVELQAGNVHNLANYAGLKTGGG